MKNVVHIQREQFTLSEWSDQLHEEVQAWAGLELARQWRVVQVFPLDGTYKVKDKKIVMWKE